MELAQIHGLWGGIIGNIPAGPNRAFHAQAFDASGALLFEGTASGVTISGSQTTLVAITLQEVNTGTWTATPSMSVPRLHHTTTLLPDGKVLVAGGFNYQRYELATAEVYDPATGTWSSTPSMASRRSFHVAELMPDGKVLVVSRIGWEGQSLGALASSELYTPLRLLDRSWRFMGIGFHAPES